MKKTSGFTVIELLIVIAVISVLISIAVVNFFSLNTEAKDSKAKSELRVLKFAIETFASSHARYPSALYEVEGGAALSKLPKDPFTENSDYQYFESRGIYAVWSVGFNGTSGVVTINYGGVISDTDQDDIGSTNGACPNELWK
jgi:general secretion pathway protein G